MEDRKRAKKERRRRGRKVQEEGDMKKMQDRRGKSAWKSGIRNKQQEKNQGERR